MSKILITGGAGYLGSVLTPRLLQAGHQVVVLDNFLFRQFTLADCCGHDGFEVVRGDCRDESLLRRLLASADVIIPLAALVGVPLCDRDRVARRDGQPRCRPPALPAGEPAAADRPADDQ